MILDAFSGIDGWGEGARQLGLDSIGIELNPDAARSGTLAGHRVVRADVTDYPAEPFIGRVEGFVAGPPCQAFSRAGTRAGIEDAAFLHRAALTVGAHPASYAELIEHDWIDWRASLVLEPLRFVHAIEPEWIALEQVTDVLPLWETYAIVLRGWGYATWTGVLNTADYGVPQTRTRAILMASRRQAIVQPPEPTHAPTDETTTLFSELAPYITMAEALGWGLIDAPSATVVATSGAGGPRPLDGGAGARDAILRAQNEGRWVFSRPATAICADYRVFSPTHHANRESGEGSRNDGSVQIEPHEALILQGFPPDYPLVGNRTSQFQQVGNAWCPAAAAAVIRQLRS